MNPGGHREKFVTFFTPGENPNESHWAPHLADTHDPTDILRVNRVECPLSTTQSVADNGISLRYVFHHLCNTCEANHTPTTNIDGFRLRTMRVVDLH